MIRKLIRRYREWRDYRFIKKAFNEGVRKGHHPSFVLLDDDDA